MNRLLPQARLMSLKTAGSMSTPISLFIIFTSLMFSETTRTYHTKAEGPSLQIAFEIPLFLTIALKLFWAASHQIIARSDSKKAFRSRFVKIGSLLEHDSDPCSNICLCISSSPQPNLDPTYHKHSSVCYATMSYPCRVPANSS